MRPEAGKLDVFDRVTVYLALGFGSGATPLAPGTFGTLLALGLHLILRELPAAAYFAVIAVMFLAGVWICRRAAEILRATDPPMIVWDEIAAFQLAVAFAPPTWGYLILGFWLFRFFDILKPWPIRALERRLGGGWGIMSDDIVAALYAAAVLFAVHRLGLL